MMLGSQTQRLEVIRSSHRSSVVPAPHVIGHRPHEMRQLNN